MHRLLGALALVGTFVSGGQAGTIYVENRLLTDCPGTGTQSDPFCSIQDGIEAAVDGDLVLVAPGIYSEILSFLGKAITVASSDGPAVTTIFLPFFVVRFDSNE